MQQLYVGYFGRPADPGGLAYFSSMYLQAGAPTSIVELAKAYDSNPTVKLLVDSFGESKESSDLYSGDNTAFIAAIYQNLFGRAPDSAGLAFWAGAIDSKAVIRANGVLSIMAGAQGGDISTINSKRDVAAAFTAVLNVPALVEGYSGMQANAVVRAMLARVTAATTTASFAPTISATVASLAVAPRKGTVYPAIEGVYYQTTTASGYLDRSGEFAYSQGEQVSLSIGGVELANVPAGSSITPFALDDPAAALNLARVVRALDTGTASTAQALTVRQLPSTTLTGADFGSEASTVTTLAKINPLAVLPAATGARAIAIVDATRQQTVAAGGAAGGVYQYFDSTLGEYNSFLGNGKPQSCSTSIPRVTAGSVTLASAPNWAAGTISGSANLTFSDAGTAVIPFASTSGSFVRAGKTFSYAFHQNYSSLGRILALTITDPSRTDAFGCGKEHLVFRDSKRANQPPAAAFLIEVSIGLTRGASDTYRFSSAFGGLGNYLNPGSISTDKDGRIVSLTWTSSKANRSRTDTPARYADNLSDFSEQVLPGERVTITLTAVDDEGAKSTKTYVINPNALSLDQILKLLSGKTYLTVWGPFEYYYRLNASNTIVTEWELDGISSSKLCNAESYNVGDEALELDLSKIIFTGSDFRYTGTDGYSYSFTQVAGLPPTCSSAAVKPPSAPPPTPTPTPTPTPAPNDSNCNFTDANGRCSYVVLGAIISYSSHPPKSGKNDLCTTWQIIGEPVQLSACSYADGGSGYTIVENNGATADVCWTTAYNNGKTPGEGCYSSMPAGMVSTASCFYCGAKNGGAKVMNLTRFRVKP